MRKKMRKIVRMQYEEATQVVGMAGLFLLLLLAGTAGAWIWSCRCLQFSWLPLLLSGTGR